MRLFQLFHQLFHSVLFFSLYAVITTDALDIQHEKLLDNPVVEISSTSRQVDPSLPNQLIIVLTDIYMNVADVTSKINSLLASTGGTAKFVYNSAFKGATIIDITNDGMIKLLNNEAVKYGVPNKPVSVQMVEKNPDWGLDRIDQKRLPLNKRYKYYYTGRGVTAYVIDTGIRVNHSEFGGRATCDFNAIDYEPCDDLHLHGTHVAGTIGGKTYGVAKNVKLVAVKVLNSGGSGDDGTIIAGVDYVTSQKIKNREIPSVINMSLRIFSLSTAMNDAVDGASRRGVVVVVAAGNESSDACLVSPAGASKVITVGATDKYDHLADFSNVGSCVDILAPGVDITSASILCTTCNLTASGTSMASPHVAGVAALYLQRNPTATPESLWSMMRQDATRNAIKGLVAYPTTPNLLVNTMMVNRKK